MLFPSGLAETNPTSFDFSEDKSELVLDLLLNIEDITWFFYHVVDKLWRPLGWDRLFIEAENKNPENALSKHFGLPGIQVAFITLYM